MKDEVKKVLVGVAIAVGVIVALTGCSSSSSQKPSPSPRVPQCEHAVAGQGHTAAENREECYGEWWDAHHPDQDPPDEWP